MKKQSREKKLKTLLEFILNILFPIHCISCKKEGFWICDCCQTTIKFKNEHYCGVCEKVLTPDGRTCLKCLRKNPLDGLLVATSYREALISNSIHLYKYRFIKDLSEPLGKILTSSFGKTDLPIPDLVIPIPLHPRRLRWRGFNQSALLAEYFCKNLLPQSRLILNEAVLIRNRYTQPQMQILNYKNRKSNTLGAFSIINQSKVANKIILLVDDVATTGSTIFECATVLKAAGAKEVYAIVVARQGFK